MGNGYTLGDRGRLGSDRLALGATLESRVFLITVIRNPLKSFKQGQIKSVAIACRSNLSKRGRNEFWQASKGQVQ